jgi:RimJ/RimL family protein N-acetyltransferase
MDLQFDQEIVLENDRVRLEPLCSDHLKDLVFISLNYPDLLQYSPSVWGTSDAMTSYIRTAVNQRLNGTKYTFVIYDKKAQSYAGSTSYMAISNYDSRLEIGSTWLGKEFQRTGLNRNCKYLLLTHAFELLQFERVELKTDSRNMQSRTAILAIGATYEGELRSHTLMTDGFRRNTVYYSILKDEWPEIKMRIFKDFK